MSTLLNHPRCELNHPMVVRRSQFGKFFGCLKYPSHKSVVNEPRCINNHIMALRKNKITGQEFFSCIKWQECTAPTFGFEESPKWYIAKLHKEFDVEQAAETSNPTPFQTSNPFYVEYNNFLTSKKNLDQQYLDEQRKNLQKERLVKDSTQFEEELDDNDDLWDKKFTERFRKLQLTEDQINEYHRLMNSSYGYNQLVKVSDNSLKDYLSDSITHRSTTTLKELKVSNYGPLTPRDKDW
jgi:ssDNA-binding Zn-finger/Zn-ribbon topoisomerase 1